MAAWSSDYVPTRAREVFLELDSNVLDEGDRSAGHKLK